MNKTTHLAVQLEHFGNIAHHERFIWQTQDPEVARRERELLRSVAGAVRSRAGGPVVNVLESGCGAGENLVHLTAQLAGTRVILEGIDPSEDSVREATANGLRVRAGNGLALPYPDHLFDVVFCRDVLHHLKDDDERAQFVREMRRVAKPEGTVFAIEPNPVNPWVWGLSWIVAAEFGLHGIREGRVRTLLRPDMVARVAPSALWRALCHYRSPLYRIRLLRAVTWKLLAAWEYLAARGPSICWAYRIYCWRLEISH